MNSWGGRSARKYKNTKVKLEGHTFDSEGEMHRYLILQERLRKKEIRELTLKPAYDLVVNGIKILDRPFHPDFRYQLTICPRGETCPIAFGRQRGVSMAPSMCTSCLVVEDFKGFMDAGDAATRIFKIECRLMKALFGIDVQVIQTQLAVKRQEQRKAKKRSDRYLIKLSQKGLLK